MHSRHTVGLALLALFLGALSTSACSKAPKLPADNAPIQPTADTLPFSVEAVAGGLQNPWGLAFLPDGTALVSERSGALLRLNLETGERQAVAGVPAVVAQRQGGLLDVAIDPDFAANAYVYLTWSDPGADGSGTAIGRGRLDGTQLVDFQTLFSLPQKTSSGLHFGSRIAFDTQGHLYFSIGDRGDKDRSQDLRDPAGSILRLHRDGRIPADNPWVGSDDAHPAIFSSGHRNPQGLIWDPVSGQPVLHEHGPQGGDEINHALAGRNYGWPRVTYGVQYVSGTRIGKGTTAPDVEPPRHVWIPSIAPSGLAVYAGSAFADWRGDLLLGALRAQMLVRLERDGERIVAEHRYPLSDYGRIRDVRVGPEGLIYLLTDMSEGQLLRLQPRG